VGSTVGGEISQFVQQHRALVIGISVALGLLLLVGVARCGWLAYQRRRENALRRAAMANGKYYYASNVVPSRRSGGTSVPTMSGAASASAWPGQNAWKDDDVSPAASSQGSYDNHRQQATLPRVEYAGSAWRYG
jgi:hypothetical protein